MRNSLNKGAVAGGLFGSLAIWIAAGVIFWPGLMMAYNTVVFPGYETCKRGISSEMPDCESRRQTGQRNRSDFLTVAE